MKLILREKLRSDQVTVTNPKLGTIDAVLNYQVCKEFVSIKKKEIHIYDSCYYGCCSNGRIKS
jgi:hypothetical protein